MNFCRTFIFQTILLQHIKVSFYYCFILPILLFYPISPVPFRQPWFFSSSSFFFRFSLTYCSLSYAVCLQTFLSPPTISNLTYLFRYEALGNEFAYPVITLSSSYPVLVVLFKCILNGAMSSIATVTTAGNTGKTSLIVIW